MEQTGLKQPILGILGTIVVFFLAFGIIVWFSPDTFLSWAGFLAMTLIPFSIIIGMVWGGTSRRPRLNCSSP